MLLCKVLLQDQGESKKKQNATNGYVRTSLINSKLKIAEIGMVQKC